MAIAAARASTSRLHAVRSTVHALRRGEGHLPNVWPHGNRFCRPQRIDNRCPAAGRGKRSHDSDPPTDADKARVASDVAQSFLFRVV